MEDNVVIYGDIRLLAAWIIFFLSCGVQASDLPVFILLIIFHLTL